MNTKVSQSAIEFLVSIGIVMLFFALILIFFIQRSSMIETTSSQSIVDSLSRSIQEEIFLAKGVSGNYVRNFSLPGVVSGLPIEYALSNGREIIITYGNVSRITFLPTYVYGELSSGENTVIKKGPLVGLCSDDCSDDYVFNSTGDIQCSSFEGLWEECDLEFGDSYVGIRVACLNSDLNLTIYNLDDSTMEFTSSSSSADGPDYRFFEFLSTPFEIDESGYWQFNSTCGGAPLSTTYYVPYGKFSFQPLQVSNCDYNSTNETYNCQEDENFILTTRVECVGGECGDANIWLDPIITS